MHERLPLRGAGVSPAQEVFAAALASGRVDPDSESRWARAVVEMTRGYDADPAQVLATTFDTQSDELIVLRGIDFVSLCEHHLFPFSGTAAIGYVPGEGRGVVGLSKLARLVDCYAQRFQLQERLTRQITEALDAHLGTRGAGCVIRAQHGCLTCRGARKADAEMVTSSLSGVLRSDAAARAEFLAIAGVH